jgi:biotin transport system substrate-specific component
MTDALDARLAATLWPATRARLARDAALAVGGALALSLSAKIQIPFTPVPMTLQTLVVLALVGAAGSAAGRAPGL